MANAKIELVGLDALVSELRQRFGHAADRMENRGLKAAGEIMAASMRSRINVSDYEYLHLRDDIRVSRIVRKDGQKYVLIGPGRKTAWRAHFPEFGTSKMSARPFAEPAFHETKNEAVRTLADEFRKGMSQA